MKLTLFKKQLALTAAITLVFVLIGSVASFLVAEAERNSERNSERAHFHPSPWTFSARLIDRLMEREHIRQEEALAVLRSATQGEKFVFDFRISPENELPKDLTGPPPKEPYANVVIRSAHPGPPIAEIVRLQGEPARYLVVTPPQGLRSGPHGPPGVFFMNFFALLVSIVLAALVSVFVLFRSMRSKAVLADQILTEMQNGNLKARFPVKRLDEVGVFMQKFNRMADEIEHLVDRLENTELRRTRLLQELAHDLRTPVASLKSFVETLDTRADTLKPEHRRDLLTFSLKEIDYLERLVEDLLFLARVTEPTYVVAPAGQALTDIVDEECNRVAARFRDGERRISVQKDYPDGDVTVKGDPHLLRRLFRNAFENAFAFATSEVRVSIRQHDGQTEVRIRNDGHGLSDEALAAYGEKRFSRVMNEGPAGRLSVGLGSVIMKAVVQSHQGSLRIANISAGGAEVFILFPS